MRKQKWIEWAFIWTALLLAIGHLIFVLFDYPHLLVHPHLPGDIWPSFIKEGPSWDWKDWIRPFQDIGARGEYRPRFLTNAILLVDTKLHLFCLRYFLTHPTASLSWIATLFVGPIFFYKLLQLWTNSKGAALASVALYLSSIGFLSGFSMAFMPGKFLTSVVYILLFYLLAKIQKQKGGPLFFQISSSSRWLVSSILFLSFFLDEVPVFLIVIIPIFFFDLFYHPLHTKKDIYLFTKNIFWFCFPFLLFLAVVLLWIPLLTQHFWHYSFDYIGSVLGHTMLEKTSPKIFFLDNLLSLLGTAMVPFSLAPPVVSDVIVAQENTLIKLAVLGLFFGGVAYLYKSDPRAPAFPEGAPKFLILRLVVVLLTFVFFQSFLQTRHLPVVNGYYYGGTFSLFFAMFLGILYFRVTGSRPWVKNLSSLFIFLLVVIQISNFRVVNASWVFTHNRWVQDIVRTDGMGRLEAVPLTRGELKQIYGAWKEGKLQGYLKSHSISPGAIYLLSLLRTLSTPSPTH